jgi:hypothetical protein
MWPNPTAPLMYKTLNFFIVMDIITNVIQFLIQRVDIESTPIIVSRVMQGSFTPAFLRNCDKVIAHTLFLGGRSNFKLDKE